MKLAIKAGPVDKSDSLVITPETPPDVPSGVLH